MQRRPAAAWERILLLPGRCSWPCRRCEGEASIPDQHAAARPYAAAIDELAGLTDDVLDICDALSGQTIEKLLAMSDLEAGLDALKRGSGLVRSRIQLSRVVDGFQPAGDRNRGVVT